MQPMQAEVKVARGATSLYLASSVNLVLNTLYFVVLTNVLPTPEVGLATLLNVVVFGLATIAVLSTPVVGSLSFANPSAVARFLPQYLGEGRGKAARRLLALSLLASAVISAASLAVLSLPEVGRAIAGSLSTKPVLYAGVDAGLFSLGQLGAYGLIGTGRTGRAGGLIAASVVVKYSAASLLVLHGQGVAGVFIGYSIGDALMAAASVPLAMRGIPNEGWAAGDSRAVRAYMLSIVPSSLIGFAVGQAASFLAFVEKGLSDLAIYNIASVAGGITALAPIALTNVLVPVLASMRQGDLAGRSEMMRRYTKYVSLVSLPIGFGLAAVAPALLEIFGPAYLPAAPLIAVTSVATSLTAVMSVYASELIARGRTGLFLLGNAVSLVTLFGAALVAVPSLGLLGVALGRAAMLFVTLAAFAIFVKRTGTLVLDSAAYIKSVIAAMVVAVPIYLVVRLVTESVSLSRLETIALGGLMVPYGVLVYLTAMKLLRALDASDFEFLDMVIPESLGGLASLARRLLG